MNKDETLKAVTKTLLLLADAGGALPSGTVYQVMEECFPAGALIVRAGHLVRLTAAGVAMITDEAVTA